MNLEVDKKIKSLQMYKFDFTKQVAIRKKQPFFFIIAVLWVFSGCENNNFNPYYIANFADNKTAAISLTFDDGCPSVFTKIVPLLEKYHFKGTFYLCPVLEARNNNWPYWKKLSDAGYEIGNHTFSHIDLERITDLKKLQREIVESSKYIEAKIGKRSLTFAYPYYKRNRVSDDVVSNYHIASRGLPGNFCKNIDLDSLTLLSKVKEKLAALVEKETIISINAHGIDDCWSPISELFFENLLQYLSTISDTIHIDTFENLSKYKIERENVEFITHENDGKIYLEMKTTLDTAIYNIPLTIVLPRMNGKVTFEDQSIKILPAKDDLLIYLRPGDLIFFTRN